MAESKKIEPVDYEVTKAREIQGVHRAVGETVSMTPRQAKYYLPPHGAGLKLAGDKLPKQKVHAEKSLKADKTEV
jgi:hypothetical protein